MDKKSIVIKKDQRYPIILPVVISFLLTVPSFALCLNNNFWLDEFFSIRHAQNGMAELFNWVKTDVHPPLYYFMVKLVSDLTDTNPIAMKLLSVIAQFLMFLCANLIIGQKWGLKAALFMDGFLSCLPNMRYYSVEVRMYEWAMLLVMLTVLLAYETIERDENKVWAGFIAAALGAAYLHYYALLTVALEMILMFFIGIVQKRKIFLKHWIMSACAMLIGYLPWCPFMFRQVIGVSKGYWIELQRPEAYLQELFKVHTPWVRNGMLYLLILLCIAGIWKRKQSTKEQHIWAAGNILIFIFTFVMCYVISMFGSPIIIARYLMIVMIAMLIGACSYAKYIPKALMTVICAYFLYVGIYQYHEEYEIQNPNIVEAIHVLGDNQAENKKIYTDLPGFRLYMEYYMPGEYEIIEVSELLEKNIVEEYVLIVTQSDLETGQWKYVSYIGKGRFKLFPFSVYQYNKKSDSEGMI